MSLQRKFHSMTMLVAWLSITTLAGTRYQIPDDGVTTNANSDISLENVDSDIPQYPDFTLAVSPPELSVCSPNDAISTVDIGQIQGFIASVTLNTTGHPAGTTAGFSSNPVEPPGTSTLTIGNTGALSAGTYPFIVVGTAPTITHQVEASLIVYTNSPGTPVLYTPLDTETNVPLQPTFSWYPPSQGDSYSLEVALDSRFANIVIAKTGLQQTHFTALTPLNLNTTHYWRVRSMNLCGVSGFSNVFSFKTRSSYGIYLPVVVR